MARWLSSLVYSGPGPPDAKEVGANRLDGWQRVALLLFGPDDGRTYVRPLQWRQLLKATASSTHDCEPRFGRALHYVLVARNGFRRRSTTSRTHNLRVWQYVSADRRAIELSRYARRVRHRRWEETLRHFLVMVLFAALASVVFGAMAKDTGRERVIYGLKIFAEFVGFGLLLGWILYFIPW